MNWPKPTAYYSALLRHELNQRNLAWAGRHRLHHALTYGQPPCVVYAPDAHGRHGNFIAESYAAICARPEWERRMGKVFTQARGSLPQADRRWRELDSAHSSDALLMNIFCYPGVPERRELRLLLGTDAEYVPAFGVRASVPLRHGKLDRTEADMLLGDLLLEAKLTESNFQTAPRRLVERYRDFAEVFDTDALPQQEDTFFGYQLVRGVLAAHARAGAFAVLCDARRPDLIEAWYAVMQAVQVAELRPRLKLLTWQELAEALPSPLQDFLEGKYGIVAGQRRVHFWP